MPITDVLIYPEVLIRLGLAESDAPRTRVEPLITAVTQRLESATWTYFVQRPYTEIHVTRPYQKLMILERRPIVSVTSIEDQEGNEIASDQYYVLTREASLQHKTSWPCARGWWTVTLVGGKWATTAKVGSHVKQAACLLIQDALTQESSQRVISESVGPVSVSYADEGMEASGPLPSAVQELLMAEQHVGI